MSLGSGENSGGSPFWGWFSDFGITGTAKWKRGSQEDRKKIDCEW